MSPAIARLCEAPATGMSELNKAQAAVPPTMTATMKTPSLERKRNQRHCNFREHKPRVGDGRFGEDQHHAGPSLDLPFVVSKNKVELRLLLK